MPKNASDDHLFTFAVVADTHGTEEDATANRYRHIDICAIVHDGTLDQPDQRENGDGAPYRSHLGNFRIGSLLSAQILSQSVLSRPLEKIALLGGEQKKIATS